MCWLKLVRVQDFFFEDNRSAFVLGLAVLLTSLSASAAAPRNHQYDTEWYTNPCSRPSNPPRHGRSPAENQLKYFIKRIDYFYKRLGMLYKNGTHSNYQPPKNKCFQVNSFLRSIERTRNSTEAMQVFYQTMIQLARLIDKIKDSPVKTFAIFNEAERKEIFKETKENLRLVICEFNETLSNFDVKSLGHSPHIRKLKTNCIPTALDLTTAQMLDFEFYKKLRKFFKQSRKLLRQKKNKNKKLKKNSRLGNKKRKKQSKSL